MAVSVTGWFGGKLPAPGTWDPAYEALRPFLEAWLSEEAERTGSTQVVYEDDPTTVVGNIEDWDMRHVSVPRVVHRFKLVAPAPYVGRPFVYVWYCAKDDLGRVMCGEAFIKYLPEPKVNLSRRPWESR